MLEIRQQTQILPIIEVKHIFDHKHFQSHNFIYPLFLLSKVMLNKQKVKSKALIESNSIPGCKSCWATSLIVEGSEEICSGLKSETQTLYLDFRFAWRPTQESNQMKTTLIVTLNTSSTKWKWLRLKCSSYKNSQNSTAFPLISERAK